MFQLGTGRTGLCSHPPCCHLAPLNLLFSFFWLYEEAKCIYQCLHLGPKSWPCFPHNCFGRLGPLWIHIHLMIFWFYFFKKALGILMGIALNMYIALGHMTILSMLVLPVHKQNIFSFFVCLFNLLIMCYSLQSTGPLLRLFLNILSFWLLFQKNF